MAEALFVLIALVLFLVACFIDRMLYERRQRKWEREVKQHALSEIYDHDPGAD